MDKESALLEATNVALPTVLTSGSILIIVGFVICFVATQSSISTVGLLIGKGAIISVLLVLLALPSFLYLLDKPIMKTTWHRKEKGEPKQIIDETK